MASLVMKTASGALISFSPKRGIVAEGILLGVKSDWWYSCSGDSTSVQFMHTQVHHGTGIQSAGIHSEIVAVACGVLASS